MNKLTDVDVLRGMLDGNAVTLETCEMYETQTKEEYKPIVGKNGNVKYEVNKIPYQSLIGYVQVYVQDGKKLRDSLFQNLIKRHLVTPEVDESGAQTFTITENGKLVALYEQASFVAMEA